MDGLSVLWTGKRRLVKKKNVSYRAAGDRN
jgi:hypothetical protein